MLMRSQPLPPQNTHTQIEYTLVTVDEKEQKARLSLLGPTILKMLQEPEQSDPDNHQTKWRPEYGSYMIEGGCGQLVM